MKQGIGKSSSEGKERFVTNKVSVSHVAEMGAQQSHTGRVAPLYEGRKIEAPRAKVTQHHTGSQGKR